MTTRTLTALCLAAALLAAGTTTAAEAPQGISAGVTVHGHWKVEVFEPDGTLVSVTEFDNAFVGGVTLAQLMARVKTTGLWVVELEDSSSGGPCSFDMNNIPCSIVEPPVLGSTSEFPTLQLEAIGAALQLSGTAQPTQAGALDVVRALVHPCPPTTPPSQALTCYGVESFTFTQTTLATPVAVLAHQTVQVTVTITFS